MIAITIPRIANIEATKPKIVASLLHVMADPCSGDRPKAASLIAHLHMTPPDLGDPATKPYIGRTVIECYRGAAFHRIAYGCDRKHGKHKENHSKLVSFLRDLGEGAISNLWDNLEKRRSGGWYGHQTALPDVLEAQGLLAGHPHVGIELGCSRNTRGPNEHK